MCKKALHDQSMGFVFTQLLGCYARGNPNEQSSKITKIANSLWYSLELPQCRDDQIQIVISPGQVKFHCGTSGYFMEMHTNPIKDKCISKEILLGQVL